MSNKWMTKVISGAALALTMTATASAGLLGDTVGTRYLYDNGGDTGVVSALVGAGDEGNFFGNQFFDYDDSSFSIRSGDNYCGLTCTGSVSLRLTSLDMGSPITGVTFSTNLSGVSMSFTADSVTFNWQDQSLSQGTYLSATFNVGAIPEPETYAMMLAGLGLLAGVARRRKQRAA